MIGIVIAPQTRSSNQSIVVICLLFFCNNFIVVLLQVTVGFSLLSINYFDEVLQKFSTTGHMVVTWTDELLRWNKDDYGGIQKFTYPQDGVWRPMVGLITPVEKFKLVGDKIFPVFVYNDGTIMLTPGDIFVSPCSGEITYFPFDRHTCSIEFVVLNGDRSEIYVTLMTSTLDLSRYVINGEWEIMSTKAMLVNMGDPEIGIVFQKWKFMVDMRRKPLFFVIHFIVPIFFISIMNAMVGMLPSDSGEKVSFSVTVFLAFMVFIGTFSMSVPQTSDSIAYISVILDLFMFSSTLSVVFTVVSLFVGRDGREKSVPTHLSNFIRVVNRFRHRDNRFVEAIPKAAPNKVHPEEQKQADVIEESRQKEEGVSWAAAKEATEYFLFRILFFFNLLIYISFISIYTHNFIYNY